LTVVEETRRNGGHAGLLTGMFHSYMRTGTLMGIVCGGLLMEWLGRGWIGLLFACAALLIFPIVLRMSKDKFTPLQLKIKTPRIGAFVPIFITGFIVTFVINGVFTSTISYWVSQQDLSGIMWLGGLSAAAWAALFMSLRWLWDPFLAPWIGKHTDKTGLRLPWLVATALLSSACFFMLPLDLPTYLWLGNLFMLLIGITILFTLQEAWFVEKAAQSAEHRHHMISSYSICSDVGSALGPIVAYLLLTYAGEQQVLLSAILLLVVAAFIWWASAQKRCQTS
jgi:predicted MFS family arabinose efflux permease